MENDNRNKLPDKELELIGRFARKKLSRDELYTFPLILCDNEIDRDNEKFTIPALKTLAELFVGKSGIFDHNMSGKDQTARIYSAVVVSDPEKKTADGEPYTYIQAKAYMVRTDKNKDLIAEIDAGIKKGDQRRLQREGYKLLHLRQKSSRPRAVSIRRASITAESSAAICSPSLRTPMNGRLWRYPLREMRG